MNILNLFKRREQRAADPSWEALEGGATNAVNARTAEGLTAVYACVQALSESTACLPLHLYRRGENGDRQRADDHPLSRVLDAPNPDQSGLAFRESLTASVLLHGNGYARKDFNRSGELSALYPLDPRGVSVVRLESGRHRYDYTDDSGKVVRLLQDEVFHLRDRTDAGSFMGKSRIATTRDSLELAMAVRDHGSFTYKNGTRMAGIFEHEKSLQVEDASAIHHGWKAFQNHKSPGKAFLAPTGVTYKPIAMSLEDAEWIAANQFSVEEVCRIFRVPPTLIGDLRFGNYSNSVEMGNQFVKYSLSRLTNFWEADISRQLLGPIQRNTYYVEHVVEGLLKGDPKQRAEFYQSAIAAGWMDADEVRRLENLPQRSPAAG